MAIESRRQPKSVDEIYGTKADTNLVKPKANSRPKRENSTVAGGNTTNSANNHNNVLKPSNVMQIAPTVGSVNNATFRRKSARERNNEAKVLSEKLAEIEKEKEKEKEKEDKLASSDRAKKESRKSRKSPNASRTERNSTFRAKTIESRQFILTLDDIIKDQHITQPSAQKNKHTTQKPNQQKQNGYQQPHHHHHNHPTPNKELPSNKPHEDDKDDDSDEFFDLIKQTVEAAIGKTVAQLLHRNFRDINSKIEQFAKDLNATQTMVRNLQTDLNNKIIHYGEESSRHYRYLCMKSEYDKMFYQHNIMMNNNQSVLIPPPQMPSPHITPPQMPTPQTSAPQAPIPPIPTPPQMPTPSITQQQIPQLPMPVAENPWTSAAMFPRNIPSGEMLKSPYSNGSAHQLPVNATTITTTTTTETHNCLSKQSSEAQMRDVIDHIQRFCISMQGNDAFKTGPQQVQEQNYRPEGGMIINKDVFLDNEDDDDIDDCMLSSDGMTPRSPVRIERYEVKSMHYYNSQGAMGDA